ERGVEVAALDNLATGRRSNVPDGVPFFEVDITDDASVRAVFADFRPTYVFHLAAQASVRVSVERPVDDARANIIGGLNVLEGARAHGTRRVIFASTGG